jgi:hypothetical protein
MSVVLIQIKIVVERFVRFPYLVSRLVLCHFSFILSHTTLIATLKLTVPGAKLMHSSFPKTLAPVLALSKIGTLRSLRNDRSSHFVIYESKLYLVGAEFIEKVTCFTKGIIDLF